MAILHGEPRLYRPNDPLEPDRLERVFGWPFPVTRRFPIGVKVKATRTPLRILIFAPQGSTPFALRCWS